MQIYSLVSQKGGAGKSTLARQLAVLAGESAPSLIIDRDPQQTTTKWWTRRDQIGPAFERPELIDLDGISLTEAAKRLRRKPEGMLFIDTRPAVEEPEAEAARVADLVIVPVRPSPDDLEAVGETLKILRRLERRAVIVVNAGQERLSRNGGACRPLALPSPGLPDTSIRSHRLLGRIT
ncbi:nucleotide-binding protein [Sphingomonas zeae]